MAVWLASTTPGTKRICSPAGKVFGEPDVNLCFWRLSRVSLTGRTRKFVGGRAVGACRYIPSDWGIAAESCLIHDLIVGIEPHLHGLSFTRRNNGKLVRAIRRSSVDGAAGDGDSGAEVASAGNGEPDGRDTRRVCRRLADVLLP